MERLFAGPELRVRIDGDGAARYELSVPHGLAGAHVGLAARLGFVLPTPAGDSLSFPLTLGLRYAPFDWLLRPLLGGDVGGYFSHARGPSTNDSPRGPEWTWSMRALVGAHVQLTSSIWLRTHADAMWAQTPQDARHRAQVFSGFGVGCELLFAFAPPRWRLFDMLLRGKSAPEGW
jgi:hypothetical protein